MTEVDLFVSTKRVKVLLTDSQVPGWAWSLGRGGLHQGAGPSKAPVAHPAQALHSRQEAMMDHALQTISYIADIGSTLVLMARRRLVHRPAAQPHSRRLYKMICHVFHSEDVSSGLWVSWG